MSKSGKSKDKENQHIQVYVRSRPLNASEKKQNAYLVVDTCTERKEIVVRERQQEKFAKTFAFDRVFDEHAPQIEVYKSVVVPLLDEVMLGYNCTVFAYGQTGTGKTYTMEGERGLPTSSWDEDPESGIIPRTLHQLFDVLKMQEAEFSVKVSFLELYNEEIYDLLSPLEDSSKLRLYEDTVKKGSVIIQGLEEMVVHSKDEVYSIIERGSLKRQTAATLMNAHSSRSHTIFSVTVHVKECNIDGEDLLKIGKLNLVDLAGSENIGRSGAIDKRAREAGNINQSLLTLGRVITALVEHTPHVPYRESKLTRLLQDSLGGRTKTSIIATISPASSNVEETLSTLDYAHRAKNITNRPEVNQKTTRRALIKEYTEEIERLKKDLKASREKNGIYLDEETYNAMEDCLVSKSKDISNKENQIIALEEEFKKLMIEYDFTKVQLKETSTKLMKTEDALSSTTKVLRTTSTKHHEAKHLLAARCKTEDELGNQARQLQSMAIAATADVRSLHDKLDRKRQVESTNEKMLGTHMLLADDKFLNVKDNIHSQDESTARFFKDVVTIIEKQDETESARGNTMSEKMAVALRLHQQQNAAALSWLISRDEEFKKWLLGQSEEAKSRKDDSQNLSDLLHGELRQLTLASATLHKTQSAILEGDVRSQNIKIAEQREAMATNVKEQLAAVSTSFVQIRDKTCVLSDKSSHSCSSVQFFPTLMKDMHKDIRETLEQEFQRIRETVDQKFCHYAALASTEFQEFDSHNQQVQETATQICTAAGEQVDAIAQFSSKYAAAVEKDSADHASLEGSFEKGLLLYNNLENIGRQMTEVSSKLYRNTEDSLNKQYNNMEETVQHCIKSHNTNLKMQQQSSMEIFLSAEKSHKELQLILSELQAERSLFFSDSRGLMQDQTTKSKVWTTAVVENLDEISQELTDLVNNKLAKDEATGQTPKRKDYIFPQQLAATSPHQRILDRARLNISCAVAMEVPLPDDSMSTTDSSFGSADSLYGDTESAKENETGAVAPKRRTKIPSKALLSEKTFKRPLKPLHQTNESF